MKKKPELTEEEYVAKYPVGTRILWLSNRDWLPSMVIDPLYRSDFEPSVWFRLDGDPEGESHSRFIGYKCQHLIKLAE